MDVLEYTEIPQLPVVLELGFEVTDKTEFPGARESMRDFSEKLSNYKEKLTSLL